MLVKMDKVLVYYQIAWGMFFQLLYYWVYSFYYFVKNEKIAIFITFMAKFRHVANLAQLPDKNYHEVHTLNQKYLK